MVTKKDLSDALDAMEELRDQVADILADPELSDRQARLEAIEIMEFEVPDFLLDDEED